MRCRDAWWSTTRPARWCVRDLTAKFATAEPKPVQGTVEVHTVLTRSRAHRAIEKPAAEDLAMRQRTLPEQRELLRGLGQARAAASLRARGCVRRRRRGA
jgi:hypothetical protein